LFQGDTIMANEIITKTVKLRRIDDEIFQTEGIIERLQVDAREILATGHYKLATGEKLKVKKKQEVKPVKTDNGESVVPDVPVEPVEDFDAKIQSIYSMNRRLLEAFIEKEELVVDLEGLNLPKKREAVIAALTEKEEL
jgi:hypothetical protein